MSREVSGGEDIAGVHCALQIGGPGQRRGLKHAAQEALANLSDAVVVGERAAAPQNFIPGGALELGKHRIGVGNALAVEGEVKVNANTRVVELGNAAGNEGAARQLARAVFGADAALHALADGKRLAPRRRGLEGFRQNVVAHDEIADVGDAEGELVAAPAVLFARAHAAMPPRNAQGGAALAAHLAAPALKKQRAGRHALRIKTAQAGDIKALGGAQQRAKTRSARLQRLAELKLQVIHQADAGRRRGLAGEVVQKGQPAREIRKENRVVALHFRQREDFHDGPGHNAEPAFGAEEPAPRVAAHRFSRRHRAARKSALRRHHIHIQHQILDVAVAILLHAAGVGGDPAAQRGELNAVGLVPQGEAVLGELRRNMPSHCTGLDAGHLIGGINPQNAAEAAHIHRNNAARFALRTGQRVGDIGAAAVGNQASAVARCGRHQRFNIFLALRKHHQIRHARNSAELDRPHLVQRVAVAVAQPQLRGCRDGLLGQQLAQRAQQRRILPRLGNPRGVARLARIRGPQLNSDLLLHPGQQIRKLRAAERIARAREHNTAIGQHAKRRIRKAPHIGTLRIRRHLRQRPRLHALHPKTSRRGSIGQPTPLPHTAASGKIGPMNHSEIVSFLWNVADLIRDSFKRGKYQDVILPLTVLRRLDCVLAPSKKKVLAKRAQLRSRKLENLDPQLRKASGFSFYNTSLYDFEKLLDDAPNLAANLRNYIAGFSPNMREVLERFDFGNTISKLDEADLLFMVMQKFREINLHPDRIDNFTMGTIFEELIRRFNEALNENPGEHFTPRDVVHLMVDLMLAGDERRIRKPGIVLTVCDPCCGSGGMLSITKNHILGLGGRSGEAINSRADIHLFGQEVNPETFAICKSDLFMKSADGGDGERIAFGSTLSKDQHAGQRFDYLIANPPYGKDWKRDQNTVQSEHERGSAGRFEPGLPRISDGQLLFLLHMLGHCKQKKDGGARVAIIMNGSPLFTGDAGSGESEIRRFVLENDWLEALIALPEQLFYNTGIATYIWLLCNRKPPKRRGKVQLIDATDFWTPMRKSFGDKRREIPRAKADEIAALLRGFEEGPHVRIFPTAHFGFRKITVERPLRLDFRASPDRIARLDEERAFRKLATSKKRSSKAQAEGRAAQHSIRNLLAGLPSAPYLDRAAFEQALEAEAERREMKLAAPARKAIFAALSERNEQAEICRTKDGAPEPDPKLRDTESVPLSEPIEDFFEREVRPHAPDAWIDTARRDPQDGQIGLVGYEINFNRYFYRYRPPRPLGEIQADIRAAEREIVSLLREVAG